MYSTANGVATDAKSAESATIHPLAELSVGKLIQVIRGKQVLLDRDLATLYGVETRRINEQVKRNFERFPEDFCFQLTISEVPERLKSQIATLNDSEFHLDSTEKKSSGKRSILRFICSLIRLVSTPYSAAKSLSSNTCLSRMTRIIFSTPVATSGLAATTSVFLLFLP